MCRSTGSSEAGPDHAKTFTAWVVVAGERYGGSDGRSKKEAEQRAAEAAWRNLSARAGHGGVAPAPNPVDPADGVAITSVDADPAA